MLHTKMQNNLLNHLCFPIFSSLKGQYNRASESKRDYYVNASSLQQPNHHLVIALLITLWEKKSDNSTDHTNVHLFNYKTVDLLCDVWKTASEQGCKFDPDIPAIVVHVAEQYHGCCRSLVQPEISQRWRGVRAHIAPTHIRTAS